MLTTFVVRIIAMLADEADRIHSQVFASKRHRIFDGWVNLKPVLLRKAAAEIVRRSLSRLHRYQPSTRCGEDAVWRIALKQSSHNYRRMRVKTMILRVHGDDGRHALLGRLGLKVECRPDPSGEKSPPVQIDDAHFLDSTLNHGQA